MAKASLPTFMETDRFTMTLTLGRLASAAYSETFERIVADLFYASANLDMDDVRVSIKLALTDDRIRQIRAGQRAAKRSAR